MEGPLHATVTLPTAMAPREWKSNANWAPDSAWTTYMQETSLTPKGNRKKFLQLFNLQCACCIDYAVLARRYNEKK